MEYALGLVSVIIPTYKRSEKLVRAIESVLNQTYRNLELLLINDNDPEDEYTAELKLRTVKYSWDKRFHLIMQTKHVNGAVARNYGIRQAKGEYIAFLDDDDWWDLQKLEKQIEVLKGLDETWGGVSCKFVLYNENEKIIGKTLKYRDGYIYLDILKLLSDVATGTLLLRHKALDQTRLFDENLTRHQDLQLLIDFTSKFKLMEVDKYLHCVDVSDSSNRPNTKNIIQYKKALFKSIKPVICSLTTAEKKCVYAMHSYEIGYICLKNGDIKNGIIYCLAIFSSPYAFICSLRKTINKMIQIVHC